MGFHASKDTVKEMHQTKHKGLLLLPILLILLVLPLLLLIHHVQAML